MNVGVSEAVPSWANMHRSSTIGYEQSADNIILVTSYLHRYQPVEFLPNWMPFGCLVQVPKWGVEEGERERERKREGGRIRERSLITSGKCQNM